MASEQTEKSCQQCRKTKPITNFTKNFHNDYKKTCGICLMKARKYSRNNRQKCRNAKKLSDQRYPIRRAVERCKFNDKKKNRFFNLDTVYVSHILDLQEYNCFHCSNALEMTNGGLYNPNKFSIDRVDNSFGHIKGNIVASCLLCNLKRGSKLIDDFTPFPIYFILDDFEADI